MGKSTPYDFDLSDDLEVRFDDESVRSAMSRIESNTSGKIDFLLFRRLLNGRNASLRWARLESVLFTNPDLRKLALLSDYAPQDKVHELLAQMNIDDAEILKEIRAGGFPALQVLPKPHRDRVFDMLRDSAAAAPTDKGTALVLQYLLDFDKPSMFDRQASQQSVELARDWCFRFPERAEIEPVLGRLLQQSADSRLVDIAQRRLDSYTTKDEAWYLTSTLLDRSKSRASQLMQKWLGWDEPSRHDAFILADWLRTSNCSRNALRVCKRELDQSMNWMLIRSLSPFAVRNPVRHWFYRFLKRNIDSDSVITSFPEILRYTPTKRMCALATVALHKARTKDRKRILIQLAKSRPLETIPEILRIVEEFPNAPDSLI